MAASRALNDVALLVLLLVAAVQQPSAVPAAAEAAAMGVPPPASSHRVRRTAADDADHTAEAVVVFGSGRRVAEPALRRILDTLRGPGPVTVRLPTGEERAFANGSDYSASARSGALRGAQLIVPAEAYPCELVGDIVETEAAQRTHLELPNGESVPYSRYADGLLLLDHHQQQHQHALQPQQLHYRQQQQQQVGYPGFNPYQQQPLFHKHPTVYDWMAPVDEEVPEDELQVVLGGTQRLSMKVHEAVKRSHDARVPLVVDLVNGRTVTVASYDELLAKLVDPRYIGARVRVGDDVKVPAETYRAVVDAHKHKGVYVVDRNDHRMRYADYAKRRDAAGQSSPSTEAPGAEDSTSG